MIPKHADSRWYIQFKTWRLRESRAKGTEGLRTTLHRFSEEVRPLKSRRLFVEIEIRNRTFWVAVFDFIYKFPTRNICTNPIEIGTNIEESSDALSSVRGSSTFVVGVTNK